MRGKPRHSDGKGLSPGPGAGRLGSWLPSRGQAFVAVLCGLALVPAFPPLDAWPLSLVGLAPLMGLALRLTPRRALAAGWLFGLALGLGLFYWLMVVMTTFGGLPWWLALLILLGMQLYLALYPAAFAGLVSWLGRRGISPLFSAPLLWAGLEWVRGLALTGFPWLPLSGALTSFPPLVQTCEIWGATGLSAAMVLVNALLLRSLGPGPGAPGSWRPRLAAGVAAAILVAGGWVWGLERMAAVDAAARQAPQLPVTVVQANVPLKELWAPGNKAEVVRRHLELTRQAAQDQGERPWLVVWPESAAPFYFLHEARESLPVLTAARELGAYFSLGSAGLIEDGGRPKVTNRTWLLGPEGRPLGRYDKVHLVPFGEYVPLAKILFFVRAVAALSQDLTPGPMGHTLADGSLVLGPLICYESIFPELARAQRQRGSLLMVNQTNDAWFGHTGAPAQQLSHLVLRAVENRVACARAANTGISAFVLPDGRVERATGLFVPTFQTMRLPLLDMDTLFTATGDVAGPAGLGLGLALILWGVFRRGRDREEMDS